MLSGAPVSGAPLSAVDAGTGTAPLVFKRLAAGRNPRLVLDPGGGCLRQELQLFHFADSGLHRRAQSELFNNANVTPETDDTERRIEDAFVTTDRRVSVVYSERDPGLGTLQLLRIDSTPYPAAKAPPGAPRFTMNSPSYLTFERGGHWNNPLNFTTVEDRSLQVAVTTGTVHAVELQCANVFPSGYHPPIWVEQVQEVNAGGAVMPPGSPADFVISLAHGDGVMQPCAFRARCRDDSDPANPCYSAWRYYLAGYHDPYNPNVPDPIFTMVISYGVDPLNANDVIVCHPPDYAEIGKGGAIVHMIYDAFVHGDLLGTCVRAKGRRPSSAFLIVHDWTFLLASHTPVKFEDENGRTFALTIKGLLCNSAGEGNVTLPTNFADQQPLDFE